jgi:hypothetical protein
MAALNPCIEARQKQPMAVFDRGYVTAVLADNFGNGFSNFFPLFLKNEGNLLLKGGFHPNISHEAEHYLSSLGASHDDLFYHVVAILHAPTYRNQNQGALRQDWPRIPLPRLSAMLTMSAQLGRNVVALLDVEQAFKGVTAAPFQKQLQGLAAITRDKGAINPDEGDLELTAGWGHAGLGGATMPGKGKSASRAYSPTEEQAVSDAATLLGHATVDVCLNDRVYWRNIPSAVWDYTISGYAVIKKWLSYREKELLGRSLTVEEARYVTEMARRVAALILMGPSLDENYIRVTEIGTPLKSSS